MNCKRKQLDKQLHLIQVKSRSYLFALKVAVLSVLFRKFQHLLSAECCNEGETATFLAELLQYDTEAAYVNSQFARIFRRISQPGRALSVQQNPTDSTRSEDRVPQGVLRGIRSLVQPYSQD